PGQKFVAVSFAVVVYMPGVSCFDTPLVEVVHATLSKIVVQSYGLAAAQLAGSTTWTLPPESTIDRPNVASTAGSPPFVAGSEPRANSAKPIGATERHLLPLMTSGLRVSPARSRPRPLRSNAVVPVLVTSNHSAGPLLLRAGCGITSV